MMDEYKEQIIKLIAIGEAQLRTIRLITGFPDMILSPQIEVLEEAKAFLDKEAKEVE